MLNKYLALDKLQIYPAIGHLSIEKIEYIFSDDSYNSVTLMPIFRELGKGLGEGLRKIKSISAGLEGCVSDDDKESEDGVLIRVSFLGEASMSNVENFRDWGEE